MVLRPEVVRQRLSRLESVLSQLERLRYNPADLQSAWSVERGLQLAAEIVFDIGNHVLSAHYGVAARDYEGILEELGRQGVIDQELRGKLAGLGGFRNTLVHGYMDLDTEKVEDAHRRTPRELSELRLQVEAWLDRLEAGKEGPGQGRSVGLPEDQ